MPRDHIPANTYAQSLAAVLAACRPLAPERVGFREAIGRVLTEPLLAVADDPPAPKSAMDGFALRAVDTRGASAGGPLRFHYEGVVGAGHVAARPLAPGAAMRIMTGALLPREADAVVKLEDTLCDEAKAIAERGEFAITAPLTPGENVYASGSRFARGDLLVPAGVPLAPQALGLIAGQGLTEVTVVRRPHVALLALGDELVEPERPLQAGQIHVSNLYALEAETQAQGATARNLGIAPDDPRAVAAKLEPWLTGGDAGDFVMTLGGSHGGDFDFAGEIFQRLGAQLRFQRTLINWGGSTIFATHAHDGSATLCFGLPGTPLPSWLAFELLVRPAIWKAAGRRETGRPVLRARMAEPIQRRPGRTHFVPAGIEFGASGLPLAIPLDETPTANRPTATRAAGLILYPEGAKGLSAGDEVSVAWLSA